MLITLFFLVITTSYAFSESGGMGNGGDAIICKDREVKVILLDSYEARKLKLNIDLSTSYLEKQTWRSMVNVAVNRLRRFDKHTASLLYDYAMEMVNDFEKFEIDPEARGKTVYLGNDYIAEINDSEHISIPEDCEQFPRQMVLQRVPQFRLDFRYHFRKSLWDQMTLQDQAMTILHEAWYRIMLENGAENSIATRYINGLVASKEFESYTFNQYMEEIKATELKSYTIRNTSDAIDQSKIVIDLKNHTLENKENAICAPNFKIKMSIKKSFRVLRQGQKYITSVKTQELCFKGSYITKIILPRDIIDPKYTLRLSFFQMEFKEPTSRFPTILFHETGKVKSFENIAFSKLFKMYYNCNGEISYTEKKGCDGPFNAKGGQINDPAEITLDDNELVTSHY